MSVSSPGHLFLSYARADGEAYARDLHGRLHQHGYPVWLDLFNIPAGADFDAAIDQGLQTAATLVVLLTPAAVSSLQVKSEWNFALNRNVAVIPLLVRDCQVPRVLNVLNVLDGRAGPEQAFHGLLTRLRSLSQDHLSSLHGQLLALQEAQKDAPDPRRFDAKIAELRQAIDRWAGRVSEQQSRIAAELEDVRRQPAAAATAPRRLRVAGLRPQDVTDFFKDRVRERAEIGRFLTDGRSRMIVVHGRSGMGKTAVACRVLRDLELDPQALAAPEPLRGIVYLSTKTTGITLERLYLGCAGVLGGDREQRLLQTWANPHLPVKEKVTRLLEAFDDGLHIILLDNIEDLIAADGRLADPDLNEFVELVLRVPSRARLLVTSREPLSLPAEALRFQQPVPLLAGLPERDGIELLRELDPQGVHGLREAPDEKLAAVVRVTHGVPRALEIFAGILANDAFIELDDLLANFYGQGDVVSRLVEENYRRLDDSARQVLHALAVFERPVPRVAIDFLLRPFFPGLDVPGVLNRLVRTHIVSADRVTKLVTLHPIDRDYCYAQLPADGPCSRRTLNLRAAEYYRSVRRPAVRGWQSLDQIEPQLCEFEHLVRADACDDAAELLGQFGPEMIWNGLADRGQRMLAQLEGRLTRPAARMHFLVCEACRDCVLGPIARAVALGQEALALARSLGDRRAEGYANFTVSEAHRTLGQPREAIPYLEQGALIHREVGDAYYEVWCLFRLSLCHTYVGNLREAVRLGRQLLEAARHDGDPHNRGLAHNALCLAYLLAGDATATAEHGRQALECWGHQATRPAGYVQHSLGLACLKAGDHDGAAVWLEKARATAVDIEQPRLEGLALYHLALLRYLGGDAAGAAAAAAKAAETLSRVGLTAAQALERAVRACGRGDARGEAQALLETARLAQDYADLFDPAELAARAARLARAADTPDLAALADEFVTAYRARFTRPD